MLEAGFCVLINIADDCKIAESQKLLARLQLNDHNKLHMLPYDCNISWASTKKITSPSRKHLGQWNWLQMDYYGYPVSRGPSIFLDKLGRGRDLCQPPRLSLVCCSSTETDESFRFETSFSRFCSVRMRCVRNCWLNTCPRYVQYAREVHNSGRFSFEGCLW